MGFDAWSRYHPVTAFFAVVAACCVVALICGTLVSVVKC